MRKILAEKNGNILIQLESPLENGEPLYSVGSVEYITGKDESEILKCTKIEMLKYLRSCLRGYEKKMEKIREWHRDERVSLNLRQQEAMRAFIEVMEKL